MGGTFTKAIALDSKSLRLAGKSTVPTTYEGDMGISEGIIKALEDLLGSAAIQKEEVELVAFSTTHAVNALLEGDVAPVGILAMGPRAERSRIEKRTNLGDLELHQGRTLHISYRFLESDSDLSEERVKKAIREVESEGAHAVVATEAFGVDNPEHEHLVRKMAREMGMSSLGAHDVSGAYGLEIRTITAAINASILPRMIEVAKRLEEGAKSLGIKAPIMVMKCDGGLAILEIFKSTPVFTILSGPAASVIGTQVYTTMLDGIVIEVGGTTTNISVVKHGKPEMQYIDVLGYPTTIRSMDVRILPLGGGDLVRIKGNKVEDVGPRSARIAGLPYAVFQHPEDLEGAKVKLISPKENDPEDYVILSYEKGEYALTLTCASNLLDLIPERDYARGNLESAGLAFSALGETLGREAEEVAREILDVASKKLEKVIKELIKEYKLSRERTVLIGAGGGASVIIPYAAKRLGLSYKIPEHAEVISSAGTAMAMVREEIERNLPEYNEEAVLQLIEDVRLAVIEKGALPESVSVSTEHVPERNCMRVVAVGSVADSVHLSSETIDQEEALSKAAQMLQARQEAVELASETEFYYVVRCRKEERILMFKRIRSQVVVLDKFGRVHALFEDCQVLEGSGAELLEKVKERLDSQKSFFYGPSVYIVSDSRVVDLSVFTDKKEILSALADLHRKTGASKLVVLIGR